MPDRLVRTTLILIICIISGPLSAAEANGVGDRCKEESRPVIGAWTRTVGPGQSFFLVGDQFSPDQEVLFQSLIEGDAHKQRRTSIRWTDGKHLLATIPADMPRGVYAVKISSGAKCQNQSVLINAPELWWRYPDEPVMGGEVRLFGRNLAYPVESARPAVYLYPVGGGKGRWLQASVRGRNALAFQLPEDLKPGQWSIRVATTRGQRSAWSAPLSLDIKASSDQGQTIHVDNVKALYQALSELDTRGKGGMIQLAAGTYALHRPLHIPSGVRLVGEGRKATILHFRGRLPETKGLVKTRGSFEKMAYAPDLQPGNNGSGARAAVLLFGTDSGLSDLSLIGNASAQIGIAVVGTRAKPMRRVLLGNVHIAGLGPVQGIHGQTAAILARHVRSLEVRDSTILGNGPALFLEDVAGSAIVNNQLSGLGEGVISAREGGIRHCIIEGNRFMEREDGIVGVRALWISTLFGSSYENYIAHNRGAHFRPPPGTNQNRGEAILMETALSHPYFGHPIRAAVDSVTLPEEGVNWRLLEPQTDKRRTPLEHYFVVIISGPGQGQARRITGRDRHTLRLERPWRMIPEPNSVIVVTELFYRNLIIGNRIQDAMTGVQFWINGIDNVIADNQLMDMRREGILLYSNALGRQSNRKAVWPFGTHNMASFNTGVGPGYFNEIQGNVVKNALHGISVTAGDFRTRTGPVGWPLSMGNIVRNNRVIGTRGWGIYTGTRKFKGEVDKMPGFSVMGNLIEENFVRDAIRAYGTDARSQSIVFRRNTAYFWRPSNEQRAGLVLPPERRGLTAFHEHNIFQGKAGQSGPNVPNVIHEPR